MQISFLLCFANTVAGTTLSASTNFTIGTDCVGAFGNYSACDNVCGSGNKTRAFTVVRPLLPWRCYGM